MIVIHGARRDPYEPPTLPGRQGHFFSGSERRCLPGSWAPELIRARFSQLEDDLNVCWTSPRHLNLLFVEQAR
jgi:hypothetical protein